MGYLDVCTGKCHYGLPPDVVVTKCTDLTGLYQEKDCYSLSYFTVLCGTNFPTQQEAKLNREQISFQIQRLYPKCCCFVVEVGARRLFAGPIRILQKPWIQRCQINILSAKNLNNRSRNLLKIENRVSS